jgi:flagellar hook-associated protein 2
MAGVIQVGGLATGLDTNKIIDQLVQLEQRPIDLLKQQQADLKDSNTAFGTFGTKLAALQGAADALASVDDVLAGSASSSNQSAVTAVAGSGASRGSVDISVTKLARGSVAGSTTGVTAATGTIATGAGFFKFQVGAGAVQSVAITATTTLQDLVNAINDKNAGVTASAVNLGTTASPDFRLNVVSRATGASSTIAIVRDDTSLAVQTTQTGQNAEFTVGGFADTFHRETNSFSDVLPGVTFTLKDEGDATITVVDDTDAITKKVQTLVSAFNDVVTFVQSQSDVTEDSSGNTSVGSLATNSTVRGIIDQLHAALSQALGGATGRYVNLSSIGITTVGSASDPSGQAVGTVKFDASVFAAALADDSTAVAQVFAGNGAGKGAANALSALIAGVTGPGGVLAVDSQGFDDQVRQLDDQIADGQRRLDQFQADLQQQFTALETLVSSLQSQGSLLTAGLKGL